MSATLKPCPFCGGEAEIERAGDRRQSSLVACTNCGCRLKGPDEGEHSGDSWNRRAAPALQGETRDQCSLLGGPNIALCKAGRIIAAAAEVGEIPMEEFMGHLRRCVDGPRPAAKEVTPQEEHNSPNFVPQQLRDFEARGYERVGRAAPADRWEEAPRAPSTRAGDAAETETRRGPCRYPHPDPGGPMSTHDKPASLIQENRQTLRCAILRGALAPALVAGAVPGDPWREVTEAEPPIGSRVAGLWLREGVPYDVAMLDRRRVHDWIEMDTADCDDPQEVTAPSHWMPLPPRPGADTDANKETTMPKTKKPKPLTSDLKAEIDKLTPEQLAMPVLMVDL